MKTISKLKADLLQTNGKWDGAKLTGWTTVGSAIGLEVHRVIFQRQPPDFGGFASAMTAGAAMIAGGHYLHKKADHDYGGDPE